jgi:uncharacterized protein YqjF (DUF2071 family)
MSKPFLKAEWRKLILLNYEIDSKILEKYLPYGTELDLWNDTCYVSLVGFMFLNTRVKGMKLPFHVNFEEVNLRFYVKHKTESGELRRGVVFIKEIVPKHIITAVANTVYREHYQTLPMKHKWIEDKNSLSVEYNWKLNNKWEKVVVKARKKPMSFKPNSEADFITEHYWGYTKLGKQKTSEYEVKHPSWEVYEVLEADVVADFEKNYGSDFSFLNSKKPLSVMLAEGSEISVGSKRIIS